MIRLIGSLPRNVLKSLVVIIGAAIVFAASYFVIGGGRENSTARNQQLQTEIQNAETGVTRARDDHDYLEANREKYEALLKSDRLIPHTRRAAVVELQKVAQQRGLTGLTYTFESLPSDRAETAMVQPAGAAYRLSVELVTMKVGAPLDGPIYGFISDLTDQFPGAAVIDKFNLTRAPAISDEALAAMSAGRDAGLVGGEISFLWRTAQAVEKEDARAAK